MDNYYNTVQSLLNLPESDDNPLSYLWLQDAQENDNLLIDLCENNPENI